MVEYNHHKSKTITFQTLKRVFFEHGMKSDDKDLETALSIINNNQYSLFNKEYAPVLLNSIRHSTNENTYECFKKIIDKDYLWEDM